MYKFFIFLAVIFSSINYYCQNESYRMLYDSIYPLWNQDYVRAKEIWIKTEKKHLFDPSEVALFLGLALDHGDVKFYKKRISFLMKNYGWSYNFIDTIRRDSQLSNKIIKNDLVEWTVKKSKKHFSKWQKKKAELNFTSFINDLSVRDQSIRKLYPINYDSSLISCQSEIDNMIASVDFENIFKIAELCSLNNNTMLNNFDNGIGVYYKIELIIWHNFRDVNTVEKMHNLLIPYIEKAYFAGKIGPGYFIMYDKWCFSNLGCQYYGSLGKDVTMKDQRSFEKTKLYFKL